MSRLKMRTRSLQINYCYNINDDNSTSSVNKRSIKEIATSNKCSSSSSSSSSRSSIYEVDYSNDIFDAPMLLNENLIKRVGDFIENIGKRSLKSQDDDQDSESQDSESERDNDDFSETYHTDNEDNN